MRLLKYNNVYAFKYYMSIYDATARGQSAFAEEARFVYNFKKFNKNIDEVKEFIECVKGISNANTIVIIPSSTTGKKNVLNEIYGTAITRIKDVIKRKYNHTKEIVGEDELASLIIDWDSLGNNILLVDDVYTTGKTIRFYENIFIEKNYKVTCCTIGISAKYGDKIIESEHDTNIKTIIPNQDNENKNDLKYRVSTNELISIFNVSAMAISKWVNEGCPKIAPNIYDLNAVWQWRMDKLTTKYINTSDTDLEVEKARKTKIEADLKQIELDMLQDKAVLIEDVIFKTSQLLVKVKNIVMNIPQRVAPKIIGKNLKETKLILQDQQREALNEILNFKFYEEPKQPRKKKPATKRKKVTK